MLAKENSSDTRNEFPDLLSDAFAEKLDVISKKLATGSVVDRADFAAAGIRATVIPTAMQKLKNHYGLDVLTISRSKKLVGWVISSEILQVRYESKKRRDKKINHTSSFKLCPCQ